MIERDTARCPACGLHQFRTHQGACRRCKTTLPKGTITAVQIVYIASPVVPILMTAGPVVTLREVMRAAAVHAVAHIPQTTKAAKALGIPHSRLKALLREAGDSTDRRKVTRKKADGCLISLNRDESNLYGVSS